MTEKKKTWHHRLSQEEINGLPGRELKAKRTRSSKTYSLGNGLYQSVIYPDAVHYRNEKGEWEDIDRTLTPENGSCRDHSGDLAVQLAPGGSVILTKGEHSLSWKISDAANVEATPENAAAAFPRHNENRRIENKVVYADIFPDVDFVCDLPPNRFKDTLIFKQQSALRPVEFLLHAEGLVLRQSPTGTVVAMCGNETIFRLPAPCVLDAQGEAVSGSAHAVLIQISAADWRWVCEVDAEYAASAAYPLRLDPMVETEQTSSAMSMAYTASKKPTTNYPATGYSTMISNSDYSLGKACTFLRFEDDALPVIDSSYYVTAATLNMRTVEGSTTTATAVYLKEVKETWEQSTITYNNSPAVADEAVEYYMAPTTTGNYLYFNIANLVRKWYNGENYGVMLETTAGNMVKLGAAGATYHKPFMTITYVSLAGMESSLPQDSIGCGRAGMAHVGLFNGNMVFSHQETAMNGNLLPVSIGRYYNSCYHDVNAFHAGNGWKFSTQKTLHKETIGSTLYYVYMDGDGTRHFFKKTDGEWKDLSGLQLTMELGDSTATITNKSNSKMVFPLPVNEFMVDGAETYDNVTWVASIENACGTKAEFAHAKDPEAESSEFIMAKDGAGRSTTATANSDLMIVKLQSPGMKPVQYEYNAADQLTKITHPDGEVTEYGYNSKGLLETITNCDKSGVKIIYQDGIAYRVTAVHLFDKEQTVFAIRRYEYGNCCTTVIESYRKVNEDGTVQYIDGKPLHYHFNDAGNLVSVNDDLGFGYFAGYSDDAPANHPDYVSKLQRAVTNYLKNHHFITVNDDWTVEKKDGTGDCSYSSDNNYIGGRAYKMTKTNADGYISIYQTVTLKDGADYTLSCQYQTQSGAKLQLQAEDAEGALIKAGVPVKCTPRWKRTHISFTVPKTSDADIVTYTDVTIRIMAAGDPGIVWVDAAQLEDGMVPNRYNLLENGTFYMNDSGRPLYWTKGDETDTTDEDGVTTEVAAGRPSELTGNAVRLYGEPGSMKVFDQVVPSIGNAGDTFVAGGWSWSHCRPRNDSVNSFYEMEILARPVPTEIGMDADALPSYHTVARVQWSEEWSGWQFAAVPIVMPWRYTSIYVKLLYQNNLNEAQFSNLFLHKEEFGKTYVYDENGNVTSVKNLAAMESDSEYDGFDNLISYRQPGRSEKYTLDWGSTDADKKLHLLRKATSPLNIVQRTKYDVEDSTIASSKGLPLESSVENADSTLKIVSKTVYTDDDNYVRQQIDARSKVVTTDTDANLGTVKSVTAPKGQSVSYTYDDLNRVTKVSTTVDGAEYCNQYVYEDDLLKQVRHNTSDDEADDVVYDFEYDSKNRRTGVKVGGQYLSKEVYDDTPGFQYGVLARTIFGDPQAPCQVIHYTYDDFKRMTSLRYGDESENKRYSFEYGANGQVARVTNHELGRVVLSEYDVCSRPMRITHMEGDNHVYTGEVTYDAYNNLARFEETVGSDRTAYSTAFSYDVENKPTLLKYNDSDSDKVAYTYDGLGRIEKRTLTVGGNARETSYAYIAGGHGDGSTTGLIASISQTGGNFTYTYDDNGNITKVVQDGVTTEYTYDALGQLIRVDDGQENATWVYEYDQGGNILSKRKYALGVTTGTASESKTFTYSNANWKDQLTAVNGKPINYDNIGNPTQYGADNDADKITYEWEKGRQLKKIVKHGETVEFKYNENGLRIQKVATSTGTTNYTLHGKNIVHMTQGSNSLHFFYDASNKPAIVEFNGEKYAYVHNLQGDIVAILDSNGTAVVQYKYDAWGRIISKTGSMKDDLGKLNPFRYRGYVYDEETGLYYLRSRYYHFGILRFLNADSSVGTFGVIGSHAVYAYCRNSVVNQADYTGQSGTEVADDGAQRESFFRTLINTICGREHASNYGDFTVVSITEGVHISKDEADAHNGFVSGVADVISYGTGFALGGALGGATGKAATLVKKFSESLLGGFLVDTASGALQDEIVGWFTVRPGTYTSIVCQYDRNFKMFGFIHGYERYTYELRIYPDYVEAWFSSLYCGLTSNVTPQQKVGEMTMQELLDID